MDFAESLTSADLYRASGICCRVGVYSARASQHRHAHDAAVVSVVLAGRVREACPHGTEAEIGFLSLGVKPAGWEHANEYGPEGAAILSVSLSPGDDADEIKASPIIGWREGGAALRGFVRAAVCGGLSDERIADFVAAALAPEDGPRRRDGGAPGWLVRAREQIADSGARIEEVARAHGVHRVYLARQFRAWFGCSLTAYRQHVRAARAASASVLARAPLGEAAASAGYADQSHMTRALGAALGVTPGQLRSFVGLAGVA